MRLKPVALFAALLAVSAIAYAAVQYEDDNVKFTNGLTLGSSGGNVSDSYAASSSIDFTTILAHTCTASGFTVTGAAANDICIPGGPSAQTTSLELMCFVSAADTVSLRACNTTGGSLTPAALTYTVRTFDP